MKVTEVMVTVVRFLSADETLVTAAKVMKRFDIGCLLVGSEGHAAGILTDRDVVLRGVASGDDPSTITIAEVMTADPMFCWVDDTVRQAARIMQDSQVRRLPVLNPDRTVAGIVTISDISNHVSHRVAGELIDALSRPPHHVTI
jgi:CBS domain-containing protein